MEICNNIVIKCTNRKTTDLNVVDLPTVDYLIEMRKSMGITQPQLARAVDIPRATIARMETKKGTRKYVPKYPVIKKIYEYLYKKQNVTNIPLCEFGKKKITSVKSNQTLDKAINLIIKHEFECIPVIDENIVKGKITTMKLAIRKSSKDDSKIKISEFMEESPPIVPCSTPGIQVKPFLESSSDCVILTKKGKLYGLVTLWDFMNQK
jgi:predicted transcriptional regulator